MTTKEEIVLAGKSLPIEDKAWVRREYEKMVHEDGRMLYAQRMCKHPHVVEQRYGQMEDQVHMVCTVCKARLP